MSDEPRDDAPDEQEDGLRQVSPEELKETLHNHAQWLNSGGQQGERADLRRCDLQNADLQWANLQDANLQKAYLVEANLREANLAEANLRKANFILSNLQEANLQRANLQEADLISTNLTNTRMHKVVIDDKTVFKSLVFGPEHDPFNDGHDQIKIPKWDRWLNWSRIRAIGELPLFGVSWAALAISIIYINTVGLLNDRSWINTVVLPNDWSWLQAVIEYQLPIPTRMGLILISSLLLVIGSTLFKLICPPRIQEFSETQWVESHSRPRLLYYIESWRRRAWQVATLLLTVVGGLLGLGLVLERLWWAAIYLWRTWGST